MCNLRVHPELVYIVNVHSGLSHQFVPIDLLENGESDSFWFKLVEGIPKVSRAKIVNYWLK